MSRVDVIVPCYRYAQFLRGCVESVLTQPVTDVRVLIIDDASPDHTAEVAAELAGRDGRVEFRRHPVNRGHIATYNEGLDWADGDYTVLLSADDLLVPGALLRASRLMDAHPDVGFVYGNIIRYINGDELPQPSTTSGNCDWQIHDGRDWIEALCRTCDNFIASPEVVVRTRLQRELGGYRAELPHSGDFEMWMRFAAHAAVGVLDADQAYYRIHGQSMTDRLFRAKHAAIQQRKVAFDALFRDYGHRLPEVEKLHRLAANAIATDALSEAYDAFYKRDMESCRKLVDLAVSACPDARSWRLCWRLIWMLRTGPKAWSVLRRLASMIGVSN